MPIKRKKYKVAQDGDFEMAIGGTGSPATNRRAVHQSESKKSTNAKRYVVIGRKPESHMTAFEKMNMARAGISKKSLEIMKAKAGLGYEKLASTLSVTKATLINKKRGQKYGRTLSERIVGLADIYSFGFEVFGDQRRFNEWMASPNCALGGKAPVDVAGSLFGREEVRNIIGRIDYGVYS